MKTLKDMGEHNAIAALTANLKAVGDDCAVLPLDDQYDLILTSDPLIENVHFFSETPPERIGHKAVCRVLSDFAAMGAEPQYLVVNVVASPAQDFQTLERIYAEFSSLWEIYGAEVVGGDLAQGPVLELHVFGVGRVPKGKALLRSGAKSGDHIYVTGPLGCSQQTGKQFRFEPRLEWAKELRESGTVTAMMDVSDGLATDLRHILKASGVGAELDSSEIPRVGTLEEALYDGEDFELLFTSPAEFDFPKVGTITGNTEELLLDGNPLKAKAFEHFRK
ncbi:thiamine-phosphate kinase [Tichowtungia aerotolerans]|uniref:Thiamine-monophosphate kinase n=1 Tax=Tichowtungia aerotolerans TaxID=2697043 RepID=A0A6P1M5X7_9BACT|nr:thiamine-phosphate kinase [Tichowtungia aerotolerans]QHI69241.1 thiamine-phosphate kinase [Tichowtungia aerotolerans]